jgi:hypothetical protein
MWAIWVIIIGAAVLRSPAAGLPDDRTFAHTGSRR